MDSALSYISPQITVRRSFVARNIGEIPLEVTKMMIYPPQVSLWTWVMGWTSYDGDACEGYGFRILNCHPFLLQPNQTHSIDIAFTPDFTLSKVLSALLLIDTVGNVSLLVIQITYFTKCRFWICTFYLVFLHTGFQLHIGGSHPNKYARKVCLCYSSPLVGMVFKGDGNWRWFNHDTYGVLPRLL